MERYEVMGFSSLFFAIVWILIPIVIPKDLRRTEFCTLVSSIYIATFFIINGIGGQLL